MQRAKEVGGEWRLSARTRAVECSCSSVRGFCSRVVVCDEVSATCARYKRESRVKCKKQSERLPDCESREESAATETSTATHQGGGTVQHNH